MLSMTSLFESRDHFESVSAFFYVKNNEPLKNYLV